MCRVPRCKELYLTPTGFQDPACQILASECGRSVGGLRYTFEFKAHHVPRCLIRWIFLIYFESLHPISCRI